MTKKLQGSEIVLYQTKDGHTRIDVRFEDQTIWLSLMQLTDLFQTTKQNVNLHIRNILREGELEREATVKEYLTVQTEGRRVVRRKVEHFNLPMILAVGYRVRSERGMQFRQWATAKLEEYLRKGADTAPADGDEHLGGFFIEDRLAALGADEGWNGIERNLNVVVS